MRFFRATGGTHLMASTLIIGWARGDAFKDVCAFVKDVRRNADAFIRACGFSKGYTTLIPRCVAAQTVFKANAIFAEGHWATRRGMGRAAILSLVFCMAPAVLKRTELLRTEITLQWSRQHFAFLGFRALQKRVVQRLRVQVTWICTGVLTSSVLRSAVGRAGPQSRTLIHNSSFVAAATEIACGFCQFDAPCMPTRSTALLCGFTDTSIAGGVGGSTDSGGDRAAVSNQATTVGLAGLRLDHTGFVPTYRATKVVARTDAIRAIRIAATERKVWRAAVVLVRTCDA